MEANVVGSDAASFRPSETVMNVRKGHSIARCRARGLVTADLGDGAPMAPVKTGAKLERWPVLGFRFLIPSTLGPFDMGASERWRGKWTLLFSRVRG
jgi:hypothetical protein